MTRPGCSAPARSSNGSWRPRPGTLLLGSLALLSSFASLVGCGRESAGVNSPPAAEQQALSETPTVAPAAAGNWETWFAHYLDGEPVGYGHQTVTPTATEAGPRIALAQEDRLTLRRGNTTVVQTITLESLETVGGTPLRVDASVQSGDAVTRFGGVWQRADGGQEADFTIAIKRGEETTRQTLAWQPDTGGPLAV